MFFNSLPKLSVYLYLSTAFYYTFTLTTTYFFFLNTLGSFLKISLIPKELFNCRSRSQLASETLEEITYWTLNYPRQHQQQSTVEELHQLYSLCTYFMLLVVTMDFPYTDCGMKKFLSLARASVLSGDILQHARHCQQLWMYPVF